MVVDLRFEISDSLGEGGMCSVYLAKDLRLDRLVALKVLRLNLVSDPDAAERLRRESATIGGFDHPNIVKTFAFSTWNNRPYIAMENLKGKSLAVLLKEEGRLTEKRAVPIFLQIADALAYAHQRGVIHRDIKPSNIMLCDNDMVKVVDFGVAKITRASGKQYQTLTTTGTFYGTALYMSPEQCREQEIDARSDLYSLGCLMYEVLDGQVPFDGSNAFAVMSKHSEEEPPVSSHIKQPLANVIGSLLSKDPKDRPQSADELKEYLNAPVMCRRTAQSKRMPVVPPAMSIVWPAAVSVLLVATLVCGLVIKWKSDHRITRNPHTTDASNEIHKARMFRQWDRSADGVYRLEEWLKLHACDDMNVEENIESHAAALSFLAAVRMSDVEATVREKGLTPELKLTLAEEKKQSYKDMSEAERLYRQQKDSLNMGFAQGLNDMGDKCLAIHDDERAWYYYNQLRSYLLRNPEYKKELIATDLRLAGLSQKAGNTLQSIQFFRQAVAVDSAGDLSLMTDEQRYVISEARVGLADAIISSSDQQHMDAAIAEAETLIKDVRPYAHPQERRYLVLNSSLRQLQDQIARHSTAHRY
jgi:serine/threonine protein kinase